VSRRTRPCGDVGLLVELDHLDEVLALHAELTTRPLPGVVDLVPAARTLLVRLDPAATTVVAVAEALADREADAHDHRDVDEIEVPVTYDGEDLDAVAEHTGLTTREVVEAHTGTPWTVAFVGFAPGFAYLAGGDDRLRVPRRSDPRRRVPAGAVGLAGEFSGVYPRTSPGGWQLIGRTELRMWDLDRDPPGLLAPRTVVRFTGSP
jgi:KipI family sensor histidine kinase inhibitor